MRDFALQQTGNFRGQSRGDFDLSNMAAMGTRIALVKLEVQPPSDSRTRTLVSFKAGMEINIGSTSLMMFIYIYIYIYTYDTLLYICTFSFWIEFPIMRWLVISILW